MKQFRNAKLPADRELRRLVVAGVGRRDMAKRFHVRLETVNSRLAAIGLKAPLENPGNIVPFTIPRMQMPRVDGPITMPRISMHMAALQEARR